MCRTEGFAREVLDFIIALMRSECKRGLDAHSGQGLDDLLNSVEEPYPKKTPSLPRLKF